MIGVVYSGGITQICIDKDPPSLANSSLSWIATSDTIQLSWIPATDEPSCSGIDHYNISRSSPTNSYTDSGLSSGSVYYYMIHAFDLVGHNEANESLSHSVPISLVIESGTETKTSGGGGSGGGIDN
ncbi:MAG: fibronectin type III domain-containing protein, partial [Nanoarchaeota archaeon]|nr:fibronectin type III domain-containing protein [Nanoarchaeota archaeon]